MNRNHPLSRKRRWLLPLATAVACLLGACAGQQQQAEQDPDALRASIVRKLPRHLPDREGWAKDVYTALESQGIALSEDNICAVLAVAEQVSNYRAEVPVPNLPSVARGELYRRAESHRVPKAAIDAALRLKSGNGRSYGQWLDEVKTEKELSDLFVDLSGKLPLGARLLAGFNPVHTGGPMQVSIDFAADNMDGYPYPRTGSVRDEVFSRRGGLYFGARHLLGYRNDYERLTYNFADFNAGWYASRNAAFQAAVAKASGKELDLDGDLLNPAAPMHKPGATEQALRGIADQLDMNAVQIRFALRKDDSYEFAETELYQRVFALAEQKGRPMPRATLPQIRLHSPKIHSRLSTAWFANRVEQRWRRCMRR